jgi:hypothetical protein
MRTDIRDSMFNKTSFFSSSLSPSTTSSKLGSRLNYNTRDQQREPSYDSFSKYRSEKNNNDRDNYNPNMSGLITQSTKADSRPLTSSLNRSDSFNPRVTFK